MDIARFHYALDEIVNGLQETNAADLIGSLINQLSRISSNPGNPQFVELYKQQLEQVRAALNDSALNTAQFEVLISLMNSVSAISSEMVYFPKS